MSNAGEGKKTDSYIEIRKKRGALSNGLGEKRERNSSGNIKEEK